MSNMMPRVVSSSWIAGVMLVRAGEWVIPAHRPAAEPTTDQALIRLRDGAELRQRLEYAPTMSER